MTIPDGNLRDFYHISMDEPTTSTQSLANSITGTLNGSHNNYTSLLLAYTAHPPTPNFTASQWHEFGPFEAGDSSISSYNVDTSGLGSTVGGGGGLGSALDLESTFVEAHTKEFVFDRTDVRVVFITLYSLVFCCCFFGESMSNLLIRCLCTASVPLAIVNQWEAGDELKPLFRLRLI